jgi:hypothetical protein
VSFTLMAAKVTVLPAKTQIKRSVAELLVRRLLADWTVKNQSITMRPIKEFSLATPARPCRVFYVPHKLPPAEVENCLFQIAQTENQIKSRIVLLVIAQRLCKTAPDVVVKEYA